MTDEFMVDVHLVRNAACIVKKNHRIRFTGKYMEILGRNPGDESTRLHCTQIVYKELKKTSSKSFLSISLLTDDINKLTSIKFHFYPPHDQFLDWVVTNFNNLITANKEEMLRCKPKRKPVKVLSSNSNNRQEPSRIHPIFSMKACRKEMERQNSSSNSSQSSKVSIPIAKHSILEKTSQKCPNFSNELISRSDKIDPSGKQDPKTQPSSPRKSDSLSNPVSPPSCLEEVPVEHHSVLESPNLLPILSPPSEESQLESPAKPPNKRTSPIEASETKKAKYATNSWSSSPPPSLDSLRRRRLENTGNSCYFNSTMQALTACYPFSTRCSQLGRIMERNFSFFSEERKNPATMNKYYVFKPLTVLIPHLIGETDANISEYKLTEYRREIAKISKDFDNNQQQDAHEYLVTLLGAVDDLFIANRKSTQKMDFEQLVSFLNPVDVFKFNVESMLVCQNCNQTESKKDLQSDIRLTVRDNNTIQEMLKSFGEWAPIERKCCYCKSNVASSSERISVFPQSLIIYLKQYEIQGGSYVKTNHIVEPSFEIDASSLGVYKAMQHSELYPADITDTASSQLNQGTSQDVDNKPQAYDDSGNDDCKDSQNDVIVEKVSIPKDFHFKLLSDSETVENILHRLNISFDKKALRHHLRLMEQEEEVLSVMRTDPPRRTITIASDGNCFFRAVSWCLTGNQEHHLELRKRTVKYLKENEGLMKKYCTGDNYSRHLDNMKADGHWATSCEIFAMANLLNVKILTFLADGGWVCHNPSNGSSADGSIFLKNVSYHFEPTTSLEYAKQRKQKESPVIISKQIEMNEKMVTSEPTFYDLVAVICHIGESPHRGHYVAYIRDLYKLEKWIYCSDNNVREVERDTVVSAIRQSGYIFFYDRKSS